MLCLPNNLVLLVEYPGWRLVLVFQLTISIMIDGHTLKTVIDENKPNTTSEGPNSGILLLTDSFSRTFRNKSQIKISFFFKSCLAIETFGFNTEKKFNFYALSMHLTLSKIHHIFLPSTFRV